MAERPSPPLRTFGLATVLALVTLAAVTRTQSRSWGQLYHNVVVEDLAAAFYVATMTPAFLRGRHFEQHFASRLDRPWLSQAPPVVAVGTSRLLAGLVSEDEFERLPMGSPIRFAASGRRGPYWQPLYVVSAALDVHPHVLILDRNLLFCFRDAQEDLLADYDWFGRTRLRAWWGGHFDERLDMLRPERGEVPMDPGVNGPLPDAFMDRPRVFDERFRPLLEQAVRNGTRVIVVDVPVQPWTQRPVEAERDAIVTRALERLSSELKIEVLRCPLKFERADFNDGRHLWRGGRSRYSRWLAASLFEPGLKADR